MKQKIASVSVIVALLFSQTSFTLAQTLDTTVPAPEPAAVIPTPAATPTVEPVVEPEPTPAPVIAPVEEIITPPADTTGPAFISVATASAQENEVTVVWTTDEMAYGYVEYGETVSYGLSTPKSLSAELDHTVAVSNLTPGTEYHYRIVAEDQSGNISYSKDRTLETALEAVAIDNVPPEITNVSVANITTSGATISWTTDEVAQGKIEYGKTADYGMSSPLASDYADEHSASLSNLDTDAEYHYRVVVQDESGNEAVSPDEVFNTDHVPATTPAEEPVVTEPEPTAMTTPQTTVTSTTATSTSTPATGGGSETGAPATALAISHVETATISTSTATIIWETNEPATSQVLYGVGETYASSSVLSAVRTASHEIKLTGLKPGTNYFYKVVSKNASGKTIEKSGFEFNTLMKRKIAVVAPAISAMRIESIATSSAIILFDTNVPSTGQVKYGTTTGYAKSDTRHAALLTKHSHPLSGLAPNTSYNFVAIVRDRYGNETIYQNKTFRTLGDQTVAQETATEQETVTDLTTETEESGGGGGGRYSYTYTTTHRKPTIAKVEALDGQVMFVWNPQKPPKVASGSTQIRTNVIIVRNPERYSESPSFGTTVYKGNSGLFTDTRLENGKTYYYSVFKVNQFKSYSEPMRFKIVPKEEDEEVTLEAVPPVVQKTPIYAFSETLSRGDENKKVEHLQVLLASESSLYQKGLITGYFGPLTENAVKALQKRYKLPVTGVADTVTLKKLEQLSSIEITKDKADVYDKTLTRDLAVGRIGGDVAILQQFLVNAEVYPEALVTGYFGALTKLAVQRFQQEQNITPAYGYFGPITKKRVLNLIRLRSVSF